MHHTMRQAHRFGISGRTCDRGFVSEARFLKFVKPRDPDDWTDL